MPKEKYEHTEDSKRFAEAVKELSKQGVDKIKIAAAIDLHESTISQIMKGTRNIPAKKAEAFEIAYGIKITAGADNIGMLKELAVRSLAAGEANRKVLALIAQEVLKLSDEQVGEIFESLNQRELEKLKAEWLR